MTAGVSRSRGRASAARLLCLLGVLAGCGGSAGTVLEEPARAPAPSGSGAGASSATRSVDDASAAELIPAVFTAEQAERGRRVFTRVCSVCHGRNEFRGPIFEMTWVREPVGSLFQHVSTTMPQDRPGSLSLEEYASVVAYLLDVNGRPAGERELPADAEALDRMRW